MKKDNITIKKTSGSVNKNVEKDKLSIKGKRASHLCPVYWKCGGCQIDAAPYQEQILAEEKQIRMYLEKFCTVHSINGMEIPHYYRNTVKAVFDRDKKSNPVAGVYQPGTRYVVPIESCMIDNQKGHEIIESIRGLLKSFKIKTYDENSGYGLLRNVVVKQGFYSKEILVVLVTASPIFPSKNNFVTAIRKLHPEITSIVQNVNEKVRGGVFGEKEKNLYGKGYIVDTLCGVSYRMTSKSSDPMNTIQSETLYRRALEAADLKGTEQVMDLFSGNGILGIMAGCCSKMVIGVEPSQDAARQAVLNAKSNPISNVRFYGADVGKFITGVTQKPDVVFLNSPRGGCNKDVLEGVCGMKPEKMVYISGNFMSIESELAFFCSRGYKVKEAWPVDMVPFTRHVETVVFLQRKAQ